MEQISLYTLFVLGFFLLIKGADYLVEGASSLAKRLGVSTLVIGLTVVAFGTSTPELVVNIIAAIQGSGDIALGNIIGSNMANLLLILGIAALITELKVQHSTVWKEIPFSFLAALVLLVFSSVAFLDNSGIKHILRFEGITLLLFFAIFLYYVIGLAKRNAGQMEDEKLIVKREPAWKISLMIVGGLVALYFGGEWIVSGAVGIARQLHLSELLISSTIIAIGTSLPELVTSVTAALKKDTDLAVGNVIGSNIFNIFWILGVTSIIRPIQLSVPAVTDIALLMAATTLLFAFMFVGGRHQLDRWQGGVFIALYVAYLVFLVVRG